MQAVNLANVTEAGTSTRLGAGGYIGKITSVVDVPDKQYLLLEYDIAEGEHKDYFKNLNEKYGFWGGSFIRSYKETALPMFKRMCSAVTKSNSGYIFDGGNQNSNEGTLVGKLIGLVLYEEEYIKNNGDVGTRLRVSYECDVDKIRKGDFKVPEKKVLNNQPTTTNDGFMNIPEGVAEELPF